MTWDDIARKLTSRKFWIAVGSFVALLLTATGMPEGDAAKIVALIMAGASVIGYVIGEGLVDASSAANESVITFTAGTPEPEQDDAEG